MPRPKLASMAAALAAVGAALTLGASCRPARPPAVPAAPHPPATAAAFVPAPSIRVGVLVEARRASLAAPSGVVVVSLEPSSRRRILVQRASFVPAPTSSGARLRLVETGDELAAALVVPAQQDDAVSLESTAYRGVFEVRPSAARRLTVVNVVGLEDYLRSVVPNELSPEAFPDVEALKAQAIAARTYAMRNVGQHAARGYDLCATPACQVYDGRTSERRLSDEAIAATAGVVAVHGRELVNALYTSTCGGHTEDAANVFEGRAPPYLRGVACPPERAQPVQGAAGETGGGAAGWQARLTPADVARGLERHGHVGVVANVEARRIGVSGRVVELAVVGSEGERVLSGLRIRSALGLRENLFAIERELDDAGAVQRFVFTGRGWGHGVGLCQVGASGMARAGAGHERILRHYYPGTALRRDY